MALSSRRVHPWSRFRRAAKAIGATVLICFTLALAVPVTTLGDGTDERSVLISSRKSPTGTHEAAGDSPRNEPRTLEPPLAPVAVATDQQPKLAVRPLASGSAPLSPADSPTKEKFAPAERPTAHREGILASADSGGAMGSLPTAATSESDDVAADIETAKFNGVQPGTTTRSQLLKAWGEPHRRHSESNGPQQLVYEMSPFQSVQVEVADDRVQTVLLELEKQASPVQLAQQLKLARFRPAPVRDREGTELGVVYPERGVVFSFAPRTAEPTVSHVLLEPISAQQFILRVEETLHGPYERNLTDLQTAIDLDPKSARAWWQLAAVELATGRITAAERAAGRAVQLAPSDASYRLRWAACLTQIEDYEQAAEQIRQIVESDDTPEHVRAAALVQLARLSPMLPSEGRNAVELYEEAIEIAGDVSNDADAVPRRAAKSVLVDAHLGMAREVATGQWREKEEVVPLWLERASAFAEDMIKNEGAGDELRLRVAADALETLAAFPPSAGPAEWVRETQSAVDTLLAAFDDELWQSQVYWEAGQAYLHALRVEHARGKVDQALRYGQTALSYFRDGARLREASPLGQHLVGRLYFHMGAVHAIHKQDHEGAVVWYEKAAPLLMRDTPQVPGADARLHGDALVSMGVSYWEAGARDRALVLTQHGAKILDAGVRTGAFEEAALAVAYGNLANMHKDLGHGNEAERYTEIAVRAEETTQR